MKHSSIKMNEPCEFINITPVNPLISKCEIKVCYVGDKPNRNGSIITKEVAREHLAPSLPGSPVVGFYNEAKGDFEEHNRVIDISNGKFEIKDTTRPYGFVDLNARVWFQKFLDDGKDEHEYLMTEGYIWTGQYPEAMRIISQGNNQSMELDENLINAHWSENKNGYPEFFIINEAIISKLCILGEDCEPCFEGSTITGPTLQFSFEDSFKEQLFSMMNEMKQILNEGGAPKMTTYAVEIGSNLWNNIYDFANENNYEIVAVMKEEDQTFAVLQNREDETYSRLNFSFNEEEGTFTCGWHEGEFTYEPAEEPQFAVAAIAEYKASRDADKCPECGKPKDECTCEDKDENNDEEEDKKAQYILEEIPEYVELNTQFAELQTKYNDLAAVVEQKDEQIATLTAFRNGVEKKEKEELINSFYMLSDEDKADVRANIDTYSLDDIEAKLSIICVRNKVSFDLDEDNEKKKSPIVYKLNSDSFEDDDSDMPAWVKRAMEVAKTLN